MAEESPPSISSPACPCVCLEKTGAATGQTPIPGDWALVGPASHCSGPMGEQGGGELFLGLLSI